MGSLEEALIDFDRQIESYELLADSYYYRGLVYKKLNRSDEAKRDFEKANDLLNGKGFKRWDSQAILLNEIYQSDVHEALNSLR